MNPSKIERDLFHHHNHNHNHHDPDDDVIPQSSHHHHRQTSSPSPIFPDIVLFRSSPPSSPSDTSSSSPNPAAASAVPKLGNPSNNPFPYINPEPHISTQFYTFNQESHSLMILCLLANRLATPAEIRSATPPPVLQSWRAVWKDRNEDTAYLTAWKRIQEKLSVHADPDNPGNNFLCFKNNSQQFVSHFSQWQDIVVSFHGDVDSKHLGLKDTIDKLKQVWTVGAKFYGIPESFIRVCIAACPVCNGSGSGAGGNCEGSLRSKRRRFEYTESFDVPAKEVPSRLQQLAKKHKVVLCIRQKYIRYKPFMAEVKDYACHRAGEPVSKRSSRVLKREPYVSKRCGCGFRIRAIVPISNYNEKDKSFVYQEEGMAVFKLYAVHSGHEPGPLDGNARIMHRVVGHKNGLLMDADDDQEQDQDQDQDVMYGVSEEMENDAFGLMGKDDGDLHLSVLQQVQELRAELSLLERRVGKIPREMLPSVSQELFDITSRVRRIREDGGKSIGLLPEKPPSHPDDVLVCEADLAHWSDHHPEQLYAGGKDTELIDDDEDSFERTLGDVVSWEQMRVDCRAEKDLMEPCKPDKWLKCGDFDAKSILDCEDTKLPKPLRHDDSIVGDESLVGIQVESFYQENPKWFDSPCALDSGTDCGDSGFRHGEIV